MGNRQVRPAPAHPAEEEVAQFLSSIPQLDCYTSTEPTFKDCFIARESWANVNKGRMIRPQIISWKSAPSLNTCPAEREEKRNDCVSKEELAPAVDSLMVFFSLFFEKQAVLNPESKLLCCAQRGYFLNDLVSILLMGATSKPKMEWFLFMYSYVGLSECKQTPAHMHTCSPSHLHTCIPTPLHTCTPTPLLTHLSIPTLLQTDTSARH
jgi:hypothetical protein